MSKKKAHEIYATERLNCAQSILKGHKEAFSVTDEKINKFLAFGSGRAEENMCGALYAALELAPTKETKDALKAAFIEHTGSSKCREIRKAGETSCVDCVRIASELLENTIQSTF